MKIFSWDTIVKSLLNVVNKFGSKNLWIKGAVFVGIAVAVFASVLFFQSPISSGDTRVIYSLDSRNINQEIVTLIDEADEYVYFAVYYFTRSDIAEALLRAKRRGLVVEGIMDREGIKQKNNAETYNLLRSAGIPVLTQLHQDGIMHIKALVTDKAYASGSYNWTQAATEANDEVIEIGTDSNIRNQYLDILRRVLDQNRTGEDDVLGEVLKIDFTEASKYIGRYAEVSGTVIKNYRSASNTIFLNFCKSSSKCPFSAVIFSSDASKFEKPESYVGKVKISGVIRSYRGSAEIILSTPDQIIVSK